MNFLKMIESKKGANYKLLSIQEKDKNIIELLKEWGKYSDECAHFHSLWTRFNNWTNPNAFVYVLMDGARIIGMNAFTCNKRNPYVNCYYFEIDEDYRKLGLGSKLFFSCIEKGKKLGNTRFTLRTKFNSLGMKFLIFL